MAEGSDGRGQPRAGSEEGGDQGEDAVLMNPDGNRLNARNNGDESGSTASDGLNRNFEVNLDAPVAERALRQQAENVQSTDKEDDTTPNALKAGANANAGTDMQVGANEIADADVPTRANALTGEHMPTGAKATAGTHVLTGIMMHQNAGRGDNDDENVHGINPFKSRKSGRKLKPNPREPYGLRSGPRGLFSEVIPPTVAAKNRREKEFTITAQMHAPRRAVSEPDIQVVGRVEAAAGADRGDEAHAAAATRDERDHAEEPDPDDEVFVDAGEVGDLERDADHLEWAARRAYEQTLEHAARRVAEREAAARRRISEAGDQALAAEVEALYDNVGADATDDNRRERAASGELLPDEEDDAEAQAQDEQDEAQAKFQQAKAELFATIITNIRIAKDTFVDGFDARKYNGDPEALLKDLRMLQAALIKIAVALAMGRAEHNVSNVDRLAIVHIKEIYITGPRNLRPLVRQAYAKAITDAELKYEIAASLKAVEAAAIAVKRSFNDTCTALGFDGYRDDESELSYVTNGSRASALLREREHVVGQILDSVQDEVDIIVPLARGMDRESQVPTDQELHELRLNRNRCFRVYRNVLSNRWRQRDAERLNVASPREEPPRHEAPPPLNESGGSEKGESADPSPNASTIVEDFGTKSGPPPTRRVRLNPNTPENWQYTPEFAFRQRIPPPIDPTRTPLSSTRMRSQETSMNTSGFSRDAEAAKAPRVRRPDMPAGSDIGSVRSEPARPQHRRGYGQPLFGAEDADTSRQGSMRDLHNRQMNQTRREDAERSLNEATTAKDVLEALKLTAQISLSNQREYRDMEHIETAVEDKEAWYLSLPKPWNVMPNKTEKYSDEMHKIRFLLTKADTEGSRLRRFNGREADYFDWRPVVIHGIHMKNVSIADKFYALLQAFKRREDAFIDSIVRDQNPSPDAYEHIIVQLERQYGGERRAYTHAASALKFRVKLDADIQESVSDVYAEVRKYISFCCSNQMELYLRPGPTASELIRRFMPQKQVAAMIRFCKNTNVRQESGSLFQVEAYLSGLLDQFAEEQEITGVQRQPSMRRSANTANERPKWGANATPKAPTTYYSQRGGGLSRPYRGARGYGQVRGGGRGQQNWRRVYTLNEGEENAGYDDPLDHEEEQEQEDYAECGTDPDTYADAEEQFYNFYEYPSDDEADANIATTYRHYIDEELFADADEYRIFAQAVSHDIAACTLCEKKLSKKDKHLLFSCPTFKAMTLKEKCNYLQEEERCFNCLAKGHGSRSCQSKRLCSGCEKKHHSLICVKTAKPGEDVSFITDRLVKSGPDGRSASQRGRGRGGRGTRGAPFRGRGRGKPGS